MVVEMQIRHLRGSLAGHTQRLALSEGQTVTFGRGPGCDIRFHDQRDDLVSTQQARLRVTGGRLSLEDQKSSNGTFLNGTRCPAFEGVVVPDGARVQFAHEGPEFQILISQAGAPPHPAPVKGAIGPTTLVREIDHALDRESNRRQRRAGIAAAFLGGLVTLFALAAVVGDPRRFLPARAEPAPPPVSWKAVEAAVRPAVARVVSQYRVGPIGAERSSWTSASGVLVGPELVLTAASVAEPWRATSGRQRGELLAISVQFPGLEPIPARFFAVDPELELALVRIPPHPARPVSFARQEARLAAEVAYLLHPGTAGRFLPAPGSGLRAPRLGAAPLLVGRVIRVDPPPPDAPRRFDLDSVFTVGLGGGPVLDSSGALVGLIRPFSGSPEAGPVLLSPASRVEATPLGSLRRFLNRLTLPPTALAPPAENEP